MTLIEWAQTHFHANPPEIYTASVSNMSLYKHLSL